MIDQRSLDDIMPGVCRTEDERRRWNALPVDQRRKRMGTWIAAGFAGPPSKRAACDRFHISGGAEQDLAKIAANDPDFAAEYFYAQFRLIAESPDLGMAITREGFSCLRYRVKAYDIYYQPKGDEIVIGRIMDQFRIRRPK